VPDTPVHDLQRQLEAIGERATLPDTLPTIERSFELALRLARSSAGSILDDLIETGALGTAASRELAEAHLERYFAAAVLMPYQPFVTAARETRHDIELLQNRFGVSFEKVCARLSTLQRPGAEGLPFHLARCDLAGNLLEWFSGSGLVFSHHGGGCPRLVLHRALETSGRVEMQLGRDADGEHFISIARRLSPPPRGQGAEPHTQALMLGCRIEHADALVYADGLELDSRENAEPIGPGCRLCLQRDCSRRAAPALQSGESES
jgi:predicted transcriptional regulator